MLSAPASFSGVLKKVRAGTEPLLMKNEYWGEVTLFLPQLGLVRPIRLREREDCRPGIFSAGASPKLRDIIAWLPVLLIG